MDTFGTPAEKTNPKISPVAIMCILLILLFVPSVAEFYNATYVLVVPGVHNLYYLLLLVPRIYNFNLRIVVQWK